MPALIQFGFALLFLVAALALRPQIEHDLFDGSSALYWILVIGVLAYAASYFARGWLAGHQRFALYGGLVFLESTSRFLFALAVAVGIGSGQDAVGLGMAVAPFVVAVRDPVRVLPRPSSARLSEVPAADAAARGPRPRRGRGGLDRPVAAQRGRVRGRRGGDHARRADADERRVLIVNASLGPTALAGFVFNVLLIVRAPLQLFQAIQTSILPHLAGLEARGERRGVPPGDPPDDPRDRRLRRRRRARPAGDRPVRDDRAARQQGLHLRPPRARRGRPRDGAAPGRRARSTRPRWPAAGPQLASAAWLLGGGLFVAFVAAPTISSEVTRVEVGYFGAAAGAVRCCCGLLYRPRSGANPSRHGANPAASDLSAQ